MSDKAPQNLNSNVTVIGESCRLVGDLILDGDAAILGTVEGQVEVTGRVEIGEGGMVRGTIRSGGALLNGRIEGDVICEHALRLSATATLLGNVFANSFSAEEGATCRGHVVIGPQAIAAAENAQTSASEASLSHPASEIEPLSQGTVGRIDRLSEIGTNPEAAAGVIRRRTDLLKSSKANSA